MGTNICQYRIEYIWDHIVPIFSFHY